MFLLDTDYAGIIRRKAEPDQPAQAADAPFCPDGLLLSDRGLPRTSDGPNLYVSRARDALGAVRGYHILEQILVHFKAARVCRSTTGRRRFEALRGQRVRIGTMDLRIAAIALVSDMTVLTRNLRDFQQVPLLRVDDWTD